MKLILFLNSIISYQYLLTYLRSIPPSSPEALSTAVQAISTALRLPSIFDFDSLFKIDAIVKLGDHELFSLLRVFLSGGLDAYNAWYSKHAAAIEKYSQYYHIFLFLYFRPEAFFNRLRQTSVGA